MPWETPYCFGLVKTHPILQFLPLEKRNRKATHDEMGQLVIPWIAPYSFGLGTKTHPLLQFVLLGKREKHRTMRGTSHPTAHTGRPHFLFNLGGGTHPVWQLVALQKEPIRNA